MMQRLKAKLKSFSPYLTGGGILLGLYAAVWGFVALYPGTLFATSPVYRAFSDFASEHVWGAAVAAAGLAQVIWSRERGFVAWLAGVALSAVFAFMAYLFVQASTASAAGYVSLLFAVWQIAYTLFVGRRGSDG